MVMHRLAGMHLGLLLLQSPDGCMSFVHSADMRCLSSQPCAAAAAAQILEHKPNAILVATNAPQSKQIKDDMEKISQYTESE